MEKITLEHHPDFVAVIDGRGDLTMALHAARRQIILPQNQCVVVVRGSMSLSETHRRAAVGLAVTHLENRAFARVAADRYAWVGTMRQALQSFNGAALEDEVGSDLRRFLDGVAEAFPGMRQMEVRATDYSNHEPHLDFSFRKVADLPGGVTATMSVKGGGTIVAGLTRDMLTHGWNEEMDAMTWQLRPGATMDDRRAWAVADGDICLLRACDWPETQMPGYHRSPDRRRPEDGQERIVGVMLP